MRQRVTRYLKTILPMILSLLSRFLLLLFKPLLICTDEDEDEDCIVENVRSKKMDYELAGSVVAMKGGDDNDCSCNDDDDDDDDETSSCGCISPQGPVSLESEVDLIHSRLENQLRRKFLKEATCSSFVCSVEGLHSIAADNSYEEKLTSFELYHVCQQEHWDCGVACLQYIFQWLRHSCGFELLDDMHMSIERNFILREIGATSIWTSDLVCILHQKLRQIMKKEIRGSYLYCSKNFKVPELYGEYDYYRSDFKSDTKRVRKFFERAAICGYELHDGALLNLEAIVVLIANRNYVAICLIDNSVLVTEIKAFDTASYSKSSNYVGHYVVIKRVSFDPIDIRIALGSSVNDLYCFVIENPASPTTNQLVSPTIFERSREASGTDEDIIFVAR